MTEASGSSSGAPLEARSPDPKTLLAFVGAVVIGGVNFVAVKFSNEELDPSFGAMIRFAASAVMLFAIARVMRIPLPRGRAALGAALYGALGFGLAYALLYYALVGLAAGTASVILASVPLATLVLAVLHRQERFSVRGVIGGVLALAGIALISLRSMSSDVPPRFLIASLLGTIAVAESSVVIKAFPRAHPLMTNAIGMTVGTVLLAVASIAFGESWIVPQETRTWVVLAWLVVAGSIALFMLFLYVINRWTASASVYALTLMPVVAVALGAVLADEPVTLELVVGGLLVLAAVYIGAITQDRPEEDEPQPLVDGATLIGVTGKE